jgi:hypothetical protein
MVRAAHFKVEVKAILFIGPKMSAHHPKANYNSATAMSAAGH